MRWTTAAKAGTRPPRRESLDPTSGIRRSKQCALHDHELFVGDDWAQDHHDVELMDEAGQTLAKARLPEGVAGITRLHNMIGAHWARTPMRPR